MNGKLFTTTFLTFCLRFLLSLTLHWSAVCRPQRPPVERWRNAAISAITSGCVRVRASLGCRRRRVFNQDAHQYDKNPSHVFKRYGVFHLWFCVLFLPCRRRCWDAAIRSWTSPHRSTIGTRRVYNRGEISDVELPLLLYTDWFSPCWVKSGNVCLMSISRASWRHVWCSE